MSNVLVIHPSDKTTDFLKRVYNGKGYDVITDGNIDQDELKREIEAHDKIIMMGHGTGSGLINPSFYNGPAFAREGRSPFIINDSHAELLKKKETISIWCFSDKFFRYHGMHGFHTGMIISEVSEAQYMLGETPLTAEETLENMNLFADVLHDCIDKSPKAMQEYVLAHYVGDDPVTQFNRKNIIVL